MGRTLIRMKTKALGDTIGASPYFDEYRKKTGEEIYVSCGFNDFFQPIYSNIKFIPFGFKNNSLFDKVIDLDFLFERPALIGGHKKDMSNCFFDRKLYDYHVFEHTKWDNAHVVNEQFMVFKNTWKFRYFVRRWEEFLWYSIHNNIRNYPDGFDIGVSALEAEMNWDWNSFRGFLPGCFEFHDKAGNLHTRF